MNPSTLMFLVLLAACTGTATSALMYSVKDLGPYNDTGSSDDGPKAINRRGKVTASNWTLGYMRAFFFSGAWTNLGTLGGNECRAGGMNDFDQVVGYSMNSTGTNRGFIWTPGATNGVPTNPQMKAIGTFGGAESAAFDINNSGQVSGYAQTRNRDHAFLYTNGVLTDIGSLLSDEMANSYGLAINEAGHIAGTGYNGGFSVWQAFLFNGVTATPLGMLGGMSSSATAINDSDHVVGYWTSSNYTDFAFHYHAGVMTDLGSLGGNYAYALSINNSNTIVGGSFVDAGNTVYRAFVTMNGVLTDLNTLLDASGTGWVLLEARAINDAGQIVGVGKRNNVNRMFLLNPAPRMTGLEAHNSSAMVSFTTVSGGNYTLMSRANFAAGTWSNVASGIAGTGEIVTVTNAGALLLPQHYYRAKLVSP